MASRTAPARTARPAGGRPGGGSPGMTMGQPVEKALNFSVSAKRLLGLLRPDIVAVVLVMVLAIISVSLAVIGPKILGHATNLIFNGVISKQLPAGATMDQVVDGLRAQGNDNFANMVAGLDIVPGAGIDFSALGQVLLLVLGLYVASSIFGWLQAYLL